MFGTNNGICDEPVPLEVVGGLGHQFVAGTQGLRSTERPSPLIYVWLGRSGRGSLRRGGQDSRRFKDCRGNLQHGHGWDVTERASRNLYAGGWERPGTGAMNQAPR